jgi:hypothetical protein
MQHFKIRNRSLSCINPTQGYSPTASSMSALEYLPQQSKRLVSELVNSYGSCILCLFELVLVHTPYFFRPMKNPVKSAPEARPNSVDLISRLACMYVGDRVQLLRSSRTILTLGLASHTYQPLPIIGTCT